MLRGAAAAPELIERDDAWAAGCRALDSARGGRGSLVLLHGTLGMGRSSLLRAIRSHASEAGFEVLSATGRHNEAGFGFGVVVQLFEQRIRRFGYEGAFGPVPESELERLPLRTPADSLVEPTFDTLEGLYRVCAALASTAPVAILIDDADLADWQTLRFVAYLVQRIEDLQIAVVLTTGALPRSQTPELSELLAGACPATQCVLAPLTLRGTTRLIHLSWPQASLEACSAIHEASAGTPLLGEELALRASRTSGQGRLPIAAWVLRAAARIDEDAPALLKAVAVLGPGSAVATAAKLAGVHVQVAARLAALLAEAGILKAEQLLSIRQPAVAEAIEVGEFSPDVAAGHFRAAELLKAEDSPTETVAEHLLKAPGTGSEWVVDELCSAAALALGRGAPSTGVRYLRRALREPPTAAQRAHVVLELGRAEAIAGEPEAVDRLSAAAARLAADAECEPGAVLAAGRALFALGATEEASAVFEQALASGPVAPEAADRLRVGQLTARFLSRLSVSHALRDHPPPTSAATPADRALLALHAAHGAVRGRPAREVRDLALRALADGKLLEDETSDGPTYYLAIAGLIAVEDYRAAELAVTAARENAEARGSVLGFATASAVSAITIAMRGRLADARSDAETAFAAERHGWRLGLMGARLAIAYSHIESGELEAAEEHLDLVEPASDAEPRRVPLLGLRGHIELLRGNPSQALRFFQQSGELAGRVGAHNPAVAPWRSGAALACAALGDEHEAGRLLDAELSLAESFGAPVPVARVLRARASISAPEPALEALAAAVETLEESQAALQRARTLVDYGAALRRSGRRREAREQLALGLDLAQRCGAGALVSRATSETMAAGARPRRTAVSGPSALTVRERQVASLAVDGLSNREIAETLVVTLKTVEWHLKNSYRKLGVKSRVDLRDFFQTAGEVVDRSTSRDRY